MKNGPQGAVHNFGGTKIFSDTRLDDFLASHRETNKWMILPGADSKALEPPNGGVIKTLPPPEVSVVPQSLPPMHLDVREINQKFLELTSGLASSKWIAIAGSILFGPIVLCFPIFAIWQIFWGADNEQLFGLRILLLLISLFTVAFFMGIFSIAFLAPEDEPIRFCKANQKVYRYEARHRKWLGIKLYTFSGSRITVYDWATCRGEVVRKIVGSTNSARYECFLELAIIDPLSQCVVERFRVGDRDVYSDFSGRVLLWETIRRYMAEGADSVPPTTLKTNRGKFLDCVDEFNPFSMPTRSSSGLQRFAAYLFGALIWLSSVFVWLAVLSRWIEIRTARKVHWGELERSVFNIDPSDSSVNIMNGAIRELPDGWHSELERRKRAACWWGISIICQLIIIWWIIFGPSSF